MLRAVRAPCPVVPVNSTLAAQVLPGFLAVLVLSASPDGMGLFSIEPIALLKGTWFHGSGSKWNELPLRVSANVISWRSCKNVPFRVVDDRRQMGVEKEYFDPKPGDPRSFRYDQREIVIELTRGPKCKKSNGPLGDVIVFPFTNLGFPESKAALCGSRVRIYETRAAFEDSRPSAEVPLDNDECMRGLTAASTRTRARAARAGHRER